MLGIALRKSIEDVRRFYISTGSTMLNLCLGGGFLRERIANIIGDESSGKSMLAMMLSACAQQQYKALVYYDDVEGTIDEFRAEKVFGMDPDSTFLLNSRTTEDFESNITKVCTEAVSKTKKQRPIVYVLDSLDAHTTESELEKDMDMRTQVDKSILMSRFFRKHRQALVSAEVTLVIISQLRDRIGITFGEKRKPSADGALRFYATQRIKLSEKQKIKNRAGMVIGIEIRAKVTKNKAAPPFLECDFPLYFEEGIDDIESCVDFLKEQSNVIGTGKNLSFNNQTFRSKFDLCDYISDNKQKGELLRLVNEVWDKQFTIGRKSDEG
jgi:recombination protein RecA